MSEKRKKNKKYSPKFKISVITDMRENHFAYRETVRKHWHTASRSEEDLYVHTVKKRERRYLEERAIGLMTERRGKKSTGRPRKQLLDKEIENDLIAETNG